MTEHTKERPIIFSAPMVRAILEGRKTQTRRVVKPQRHPFGRMLTAEEVAGEVIGDTCAVRCPYGQPGDRLWVRETWGQRTHCPPGDDCYEGFPIYRADFEPCCGGEHYTRERGDGTYEDARIRRWTPSIHMPRWASRITLEVTGVRVERLNEISPSDALSEGVFCPEFGYAQNGERAPVGLFAGLWEDINGHGSWEANPWVWVVEFKRVQP